MMRYVLAVSLCLVFPLRAFAEPAVDDIVNYRAYSETFASAGQPDETQLEAAKRAGYERIIYLAFSDQENALPAEDRIVKELGMQYLHLPIDFGAPTAGDFNIFAAAMRAEPEKKTLLHCQVNYRASAFSLLYRVIHTDVPLAEARSDMYSVWTPTAAWRDLIFEVLDAHGISTECAGCDWPISQ